MQGAMAWAKWTESNSAPFPLAQKLPTGLTPGQQLVGEVDFGDVLPGTPLLVDRGGGCNVHTSTFKN